MERRVRQPKDPGGERRSSARFAITLDVRYSTLGRRKPVRTGFGRTIDVSSSGLRFTADSELATGSKLEVSVTWPVLLDNGVQLQLVMSGLVVRTSGNVVDMRIERHEFKTRSGAQAGPVPYLGS